MQVEIKQNGNRLRQIHHQGAIYLLVSALAEYEIELYNDSAFRVEAVVSVDGLSIMNGDKASTNDRGYILNPFQRTSIPGWRRDSGEVAKFVFGDKDESYSAMIGKGTKNTSVIGVAVFAEMKPDWSLHATVPRKSSPRGGGVRGMSASIGTSYNASPDLGTGYGEAATFHTTTVSFMRANQSPDQTIVLRYGVKEKLVEWGVPVDETVSPNPFPADGCPAPAGWKG